MSWRILSTASLPDTVAEDGKLMDHLPVFAGLHVLRDNLKIAEIMAEHGGVIIGKLVHSYPHSGGQRAPLVYRNTAQWFVSMDHMGFGIRLLPNLSAQPSIRQPANAA